MTFLPQEVIRKKRMGEVLDESDIFSFVDGITDSSITDSQISAFAMAVYFRGMELSESVALTIAMRESGEVLDWSNLDGPVLDKHSTGGVGDNVSLMLAPAIAVCGGYVPMISGRGLGHTGGTLDKLDSIPGYQSQPDTSLFRKVTEQVGCAIIGQTDDLAPADKRFYAVRDTTATVESIPLITASILSKKLAGGLQGLVLDVKCGNGAFMLQLSEAQELAKSLVMVAHGSGLVTRALITDMNQPLSSSAGNALEVQSAIDFLTQSRVDNRLRQVVVELGAELLVSGALASDVADGRTKMEQAFTSGRAAQAFEAMVMGLGGPSNLLTHSVDHLPQADFVADIISNESGVVRSIDTRTIGLAIVGLGGGRVRPQDSIDPSVGFSDITPIGETIDSGDCLARVHAKSESDATRASELFLAAYEFGESPPTGEVILERISV